MNTLLDVALSQIGIKEIAGPEHNPDVLKYFHQCGFSGIRNDETAWCSAFVNWVACIAGYERSNALNARSWINDEHKVKIFHPGDIAVFWRESLSSWKGHVGFPITQRGNDIHTLGGNQNNQVCIKAYPAKRLIGYYRLPFVGWK